MTSLSQEDIMSNTKTVVQGLDTLKNEHHQILNGLLTSVKTIKKENGDTNLMEEKTNILKKSLETIELGLSEAQVCWTLVKLSLETIELGLSEAPGLVNSLVKLIACMKGKSKMMGKTNKQTKEHDYQTTVNMKDQLNFLLHFAEFDIVLKKKLSINFS